MGTSYLMFLSDPNFFKRHSFARVPSWCSGLLSAERGCLQAANVPEPVSSVKTLYRNLSGFPRVVLPFRLGHGATDPRRGRPRLFARLFSQGVFCCCLLCPVSTILIVRDL